MNTGGIESAGRRTSLLALGFVAGFASALFGIGGGLVVVPFLTIVLDVPVKRAIGTSLACVVVVAVVGVIAELLYRPTNVRFEPGLVLALGSMVGARLGAALVKVLPARVLSKLFAAFVILAGLKMLGLVLGGHAKTGFALEEFAALPIATLVAIGLFAGLASSLFGVGGGIVIVPALTFFSTDISVVAARATSLLTIVPTSIVGTIAHRRIGNVDESIARRLLPLAFVGSIAGVLVANHVGELSIARAFGVFLLIAASWILFRRDVK
ncbi:MAG: sulfite exporter TauE/SafE family protein [Planctomycetes bacterium]|nr:sulfite exporter TauE/SafE family protein [Planctomycetota bacterium]MBI3847562.1 sulfite exporter TauE/SafE family protein [Planctomycetota bacterium]